MKIRINTNLAPLAATLLVTLLLFAGGAARYDGFGTFGNFLSILNDSTFVGIAAIGATFVILSGGIDLSIGAMIAFTSTLMAVLIERQHVHPAAAIFLSMLVGCGSGLVTGSLIHVFELPPFMVTLAGMFFWRAMGFVIAPQSVSIKDSRILSLATMGIHLDHATIPLLTIAFLGVFGTAFVIAHYTGFGRSVYAIGGSESSARLMGVPIGRTKVMLYMLAGGCSALAGVVATIYKCSGDPAGFVGTELDAIAAVVIGGTLLSGGVGYISGTILGVLILGLIQAIINFEGTLSAAWTRIAVGTLVLGFILLQKGLSRLAFIVGSDARTNVHR